MATGRNISPEEYAASPEGTDWVLDARAARRPRRRRMDTRALSLFGSIIVHGLLLAFGATVVWQAGVLQTEVQEPTDLSFESPGDAAPSLGLTHADFRPDASPQPSSTGEFTGAGDNSLLPSTGEQSTGPASALAGLSTAPVSDESVGPASLAAYSRSSTTSGVFSAFAAEGGDEAGDGQGIGVATPGLATGPSTVTFAGLGASSVRSVVYAVDASGPMVTSLPMVLRELERSISRLSATQKFGVVVFRRQADGGPAAEAFAPVLVRATPSARQMLHDWLAKIEPAGRSSPLAGLEAALSMRPDAVFLLSRSIQRSGGGVWELGMDQTLARLERLNAIDVDTSRRPVLIQTIQFLEEDPTGIMQAIGVRHGGGEGYRVVRRQQDLIGARAAAGADESARADAPDR